MLARLAGVDRLHGVPVVGRGDDDRIDVLAQADVAIVAIGRHARACQLDRVRQSALIDIAHGGDSDLALFPELRHPPQVARAHAADTDVGHGQPLVGSRSVGGGEDS